MSRTNPGKQPDLVHDTFPTPEGANNNEAFDPTVDNARKGVAKRTMDILAQPAKDAYGAAKSVANKDVFGAAKGAAKVAASPLTVPVKLMKNGAEIYAEKKAAGRKAGTAALTDVYNKNKEKVVAKGEKVQAAIDTVKKGRAKKREIIKNVAYAPIALAKKSAEVTGNAVKGAATAAKNGVVTAAENKTLELVKGAATSARGGVETPKTVTWRVPGEGEQEITPELARQYSKENWGEEVRKAA
ncbi:hypothetical protein HOD30_02135 [Candidatus Peregrinibacteria bacterium]|jgi:hypothetical protein|nr:hypothetical protein [Candidatus Peregrinibacteria bacterium]MBT4631588.1 hypothetical protein [Candidatus Peregrinibacteria bacterium]MBT5824115.1 hypothetical protein [Candidatus Peregrinibacteria bacterium]